jgi:hypothetical protein
VRVGLLKLCAVFVLVALAVVHVEFICANTTEEISAGEVKCK